MPSRTGYLGRIDEAVASPADAEQPRVRWRHEWVVKTVRPDDAGSIRAKLDGARPVFAR